MARVVVLPLRADGAPTDGVDRHDPLLRPVDLPAERRRLGVVVLEEFAKAVGGRQDDVTSRVGRHVIADVVVVNLTNSKTKV